MLDFGNRKDLMFAFIIGVLLVIAFVIFSFVMIWKPSNNEKKFKVGAYDVIVNIDDSNIVNEYVEKISLLTKNEEYDKLYEYLSKDYIEYSKITKDKLKEKLEYWGIDKQALSIESYTVNSIEGYNKVFYVTVKGELSNKSARIIIKEYSPRDFEISLDDIVLYSNETDSQIVENIELQYNIKRYTMTYALYEITIINHNKYSVYMNNSASGETFNLRCSSNTNRNPSSTDTRNEKIELKPEEPLTYKVSFRIDDIKISEIYGIVIKGVKYSDDNIADMLFSI